LKSKKKPGLKLYTIKYKGVYLGGVAIVLARDEERARLGLLQHPDCPDDVKTQQLDIYEHPYYTHESVIYHDNGDY